jgi:hypothetical protein
MKYKTFIKISLLSIFIIPLSIFLFNFLIDPFNWNNSKIFGLSKKHLSYDRFSKIGIANQENFDGINIGMSTSQLIDPNIIENNTKKSFYNFSMTGSTPFEQKTLLNYVLNKQKLSTVIIAIDEFNYHTKRDNITRDFPIERYEENYLFLKYYFRPMMIRQSLKTLLFHFTNKDKGLGILEYHGMENWELEKANEVNLDQLKSIEKSMKNMIIVKPNTKGNFHNSISYLDEMINSCLENDVKNIILFFPPQYVKKYAIQKKYLFNYYIAMIQFKKKIFNYNSSRIKVYDFSFFNEFNTNTSYFWDHFHIKKKYSDKISFELSNGCKDKKVCKEISKENIDKIISQFDKNVDNLIHSSDLINYK